MKKLIALLLALVMVLHEGHKMGELMVEEASQEKIMAMCV